MPSISLKFLIASFLTLLDAGLVQAQHQHGDTIKHCRKMMRDSLKAQGIAQHGMQHIPMDMDTMTNMTVPMSHSFSRNLPMSRNGSGTSWLPDAAPMYGIMKHTERWMYMFHGNVVPRYIATDFTEEGLRGDEKFSIPNWFMAMGQRNIGKSGFELSLDENIFGEGRLFPVNALTLGLDYDLLRLAKLRLAAGSQLPAYHTQERLDNL
jgi:hypothetical protein